MPDLGLTRIATQGVFVSGVVLLMTVFLIAAAFVLGGFGSSRAVQEYRSLWEAKAPAAYSYHFTPYCYCATDGRLSYTVVVTPSGVTTNLDEEWLGIYPSGSVPTDKVKTISDIFAILDRAAGSAERLEVEYHPDYGFPESIAIDWKVSAIDDEWSATVSEFRVLVDDT